MMTILRSVMRVPPHDHADHFYSNYQRLIESGLEFADAADQAIWRFIQEWCASKGHVPEVSSIRSYFVETGEDRVANQLELIANEHPKTRGDFESYVIDKVKAQRQLHWEQVMVDASVISSKGMKVKEGKQEKIVKGAEAAFHYINDRGRSVISPVFGGHLSGEILSDEDGLKREYELRESDPTAGIGQFTGLSQIDTATHGSRPQELWIHAAFTGHGKSLFCTNWAYHQAVFHGWNVCYFSLEMPYHQIRRQIAAMHTIHRKFREVRLRLGLQKDPTADVGLSYGKIRDAELSPAEKDFYFNYVLPDLKGKRVLPVEHPDYDPANYGKIFVEIADPGKNDFTIIDLRAKAEIRHAKTAIKMIVVDHIGLMDPRKWVSSRTERQNEVVRDLKKLSMNFNMGQGVAVVGLAQVNRDGLKTALKRKEKTGTASFDLTNLAYANELEKCVAAGTKVPTHRGTLPIEDVLVGDKVWSSSGWKEVRNKWDNGEQEVVEVHTTTGHLEATRSHRVRVFRRGEVGWARVGALSKGDTVLSAKENTQGYVPLEVLNIVSAGKASVWDLDVGGDFEYQTGPILSHNSADIVSVSWLDDELKKRNRMQFQCLKSRDQEAFEMFLGRVEWPCRKLFTCYDPVAGGGDAPSEVNLEDAAASIEDDE